MRCPIFSIVAEDDYITPPSSSLALLELTEVEHNLTRMSGGHIGLSTGRAAHEKLWPAVSQWLHAHDGAKAASSQINDAIAQKNGANAKQNGATAPRRKPAAGSRAQGEAMMHLGDWTAYGTRRTPEATALLKPLSGRRWSCRHLERRANRLANALAAGLGVGRRDRVAFVAHNRGEHFEALFACAKLGALFAPLNWRLAPAELDMVLRDAEPKVLLYDRVCADSASSLTAAVPERVAFDEPHAGGRSYRPLLAAASDAPPRSSSPSLPPSLPPSSSPSLPSSSLPFSSPSPRRSSSPSPRQSSSPEIDVEEPLILCYASGTTGRPKGGLLSHRQLLFNSLSTHLALRLSSSDSTLVFMRLFHTGGLNCLATPLLHNGGRVVIVPSFDAERARHMASDERITLHMGVPTMFQLWRDARSFARVDLSSTRMFACGGAPCRCRSSTATTRAVSSFARATA